MTHLIDPTAYIADDVHLGPFVVIGPNVEIGPGVRIEGFASIGTPPEHRDHFHDCGPHGVRIGAGCVIREFVTINAGTERTTRLADGVAMLRSSHAGHDAHIEESATVSCGVLIGGHAWIGPRANLGLGAVVHQHRSVGALAMVGMNATVTRDIPPFVTAVGTPARPIGINRVGVERAGLDLEEAQRWWASLGRLTSPDSISGALGQHIAAWEANCSTDHGG